MKTLALILAVLLPVASFGQAADAPLNPHPPGRSLHFAAGEIVPYSAQCLEDTEHTRREFNNAQTARTLVALKRDNVSLPTPAFIALLGGAGVAVATAIVLGVALAQKKPAP